MQRKSSIHISKGELSYCFHNTRQKQTSNSIFSTDNNIYDTDALKAIEIYRTELDKREQAYTSRTGRKLHKNTITHLSAIVNLNETHSLDDVKKVAEYLEKTLGTKVFQIAIHRDEGYIDEDTKEKHINYHAHLELLGLDEKGNSVRRKFSRSYLISLQSEVAKILNMDRGINYTKEKKKRPKRLDTYEYKEHAKRKAQKLQPILKENKQLKKENEKLKLSKKDLEKQISSLRKQMIEFNKNREVKEFTREDYQYLSKLKRALHGNTLKESYDNFIQFYKDAKKRIKKLEEENKELTKKNKELEEQNQTINYSEIIKGDLDLKEIKRLINENDAITDEMYNTNTKIEREIRDIEIKVKQIDDPKAKEDTQKLKRDYKAYSEDLDNNTSINTDLKWELEDNKHIKDNRKTEMSFLVGVISKNLKILKNQLNNIYNKMDNLIDYLKNNTNYSSNVKRTQTFNYSHKIKR